MLVLFTMLQYSLSSLVSNGADVHIAVAFGMKTLMVPHPGSL